jgi:RecB family exonuclease
MLSTSTRVKSPYPTTSFSRLEAYQKCSEFYRLKYVDKLPTAQQFYEVMEVGSMTHEVLEQVLDPKSEYTPSQTEEVFALLLPIWIDKYSLELDVVKVYKIIKAVGLLLYQASGRYQGTDPIRNNDGSVPSNVLTYPPKSWTQAVKDSGISQARLELDNVAGNQNNIFKHTSFSYFLGKVFSYVTDFRLPSWYGETLAVELPVSTTDKNQVKLPDKELSFNAYIDLVFRSKDGKLIIADHKTSAAKPTPESVIHHPQLNLYGVLYRELYGEAPFAIAIHHVKSGEFILAQFDEGIARETMQHLLKIIDLTEKEAFVKKHPGDFNTPCFKKDYRSGVITEVCPYLEKCWQTYYEVVKDQIIP